MKIPWRSQSGLVVLSDDAPEQLRGPWWLMIPALASFLIVGILCFRQLVLKIPVPTRPLTGGVVDTRRMAAFTWNKMEGETTVYRIQVSDTRNFKHIVYETRVRNMNEIKQKGIVEPGGKYYWRMCAIRKGRSSPWTRRMRFYTR
jgi:hypothetical protein